MPTGIFQLKYFQLEQECWLSSVKLINYIFQGRKKRSVTSNAEASFRNIIRRFRLQLYFPELWGSRTLLLIPCLITSQKWRTFDGLSKNVKGLCKVFISCPFFNWIVFFSELLSPTLAEIKVQRVYYIPYFILFVYIFYLGKLIWFSFFLWH